ncbi:DNA polymerase I B, chloroplastic/mitochondrial-like [Dorcoceras hygrometricum]|uniref:DNA polymerase I B, chloroplastic/mitochondrial-like n=1 Tax=Dorcoceras hygrometricum TaxID=472368 RepID=A0A2Z7BNF4_9LAMI|nr:DNA polymerase I B, chloroplastic/mitochondrial-like [Dorcoceras hygrometricum]
MAKMGFSAQTSAFRPSSFYPQYFWLCRSGTRFCSFNASTKVFSRLDGSEPQSVNNLLSNGTLNVDLLELKRGSSYSTSQYDRSERRENAFMYPPLNKPSEHEIWSGGITAGHTASDWVKVTEDYKMKRRPFAINRSANIEILRQDKIADKDKSGRSNVYEGEGEGLSKKEREYVGNLGLARGTCVSHDRASVIHVRRDPESYTNDSEKKVVKQSQLMPQGVNSLKNYGHKGSITCMDSIPDEKDPDMTNGKSVSCDGYDEIITENIATAEATELRKRLSKVYDKVLVVDSITAAEQVVNMLTNQYKNHIHACDTEACIDLNFTHTFVANIDVKEETPVDHGEIICFSIYSGSGADFGDGKSCIWVDVLDGGGRELLTVFAPFFEDGSIKKVWHNYSFDYHVIENYGLKVDGFFADTMHMARLWNSARRTEGGYSLEALTGDSEVMSDAKRGPGEEVIGKVSMKTIFGRRKLRMDGSVGKLIIIPPVEDLQRVERELWICYSALDSIGTLKLYQSLEKKLLKRCWILDGQYKGSMFKFYQQYMCPFGELLVKMEAEGMLVDRDFLSEIERVAKAEQLVSAARFRKWASKYCPDAKYMNVGSDAQLRQLFFGGIQNRKDPNEFLPVEKEFRVPNIDNIIEEGKKSPTKYCKITLRKPDGVDIETDKYTASGWPSVSGDVLKNLAGKVSAEFDFVDEDIDEELTETATKRLSEENETPPSEDRDTSAYGAAYAAFGGGQAGIEACHAIAALCEVCSIDSLISNFILPLQGNHISGKEGRIHCSLNINTETGRLSARRPNLQNQPALEKDRYKIRQAFVAAPGNSLIVADYGQLELRILAHLANCESMLNAFKAGGDFHSRTAMNMYPHIREAVERKDVHLEWHPQPGEDGPPAPLLYAFASVKRKAKMLNFSIAIWETTVGLARDWKVSREEAQKTVDLWYSDRKEVLLWQDERKKQARRFQFVDTLLGRARHFPSLKNASSAHKAHIDRAAINTPVQGSAADVAMCAMLEISKNTRLKVLGWRLLLQVHDEVILEGPTESAEEAKTIVVECMSKPFNGENILRVDLSVDAKCAQNWYSAK